MIVAPGVEFKAIEGNAAAADGNFRQPRPDFRIEAVLVHAEVAWGVAQPDKSWLDIAAVFPHGASLSTACFSPNQDGKPDNICRL